MPAALKGVFAPPQVKLWLPGTRIFNAGRVDAVLRDLRLSAGSAIATAAVSYPARYARDSDPQMGRACRIQLGDRTVFRGIVAGAPFTIDGSEDEIALALADDRWLLRAHVVGEHGTGTQTGGGFRHVGYDCAFNPEGRPNKQADAIDFDLGPAAELWTCADILDWLFAHYVDEGVSYTAPTTAGWTRSPHHLVLTGMTPLEALDDLCRVAGTTWALAYQSSQSVWREAAPGVGTERAVRLFNPGRGSGAAGATREHAASLRSTPTVRYCADTYQAVSGAVVVEATYTNAGASPLLALQTGFADPQYVARFAVDTTKYSANLLGCDLVAGARPKPWLGEMVTRLAADADAYLSAAQIAAAPALASNPRVAQPLCWVRTDSKASMSGARLVASGMRIDMQACTVDFVAEPELLDAAGEPERVAVPDWSAAGVWLSVATRIEEREHAETATSARYLPAPMRAVASMPDLVPERRHAVVLPDLTSDDANATTTLAAGATAESYVTHQTALDAIAAAALSASPAIEREVEVEWPFMPEVEIGDRLSVAGRNSVDIDASLVVVDLSFAFEDGVPVAVRARATNVLAAVDAAETVARMEAAR